MEQDLQAKTEGERPMRGVLCYVSSPRSSSLSALSRNRRDEAARRTITLPCGMDPEAELIAEWQLRAAENMTERRTCCCGRMFDADLSKKSDRNRRFCSDQCSDTSRKVSMRRSSKKYFRRRKAA
jgi:hypothetical protein